jgi:hypothetical protein
LLWILLVGQTYEEECLIDVFQQPDRGFLEQPRRTCPALNRSVYRLGALDRQLIGKAGPEYGDNRSAKYWRRLQQEAETLEQTMNAHLGKSLDSGASFLVKTD